jgi:hypothetical protein
LGFSPDYWAGAAIEVGVSMALTLPFFLPCADRSFERTLRDAGLHSANLPAFAASAAWAHRPWPPLVSKYNEVLFPGVLAVVMGLAAAVTLVRRGWRGGAHDVGVFYLLIGGVGFWLALGFGFLGAPARAGVLVTLALCVLSAGVVRHLVTRSRHTAMTVTALILLAVVDLARFPLTQFRPVPPVPAAYDVLASLPRGAL